jgi:hypothetical protein
MVRFLDCEEANLISEIVPALPAVSFGADADLTFQASVMGQCSGRETSNVVSERNSRLVLVRRLVNDPVNHPPIVIGNDRA